MAFVLLIAEPTGQRAQRTQEEGRALYERMLRFAGDLQSRGVLRVAESLVSEDKATRVQVRNGESRVVEGPDAEAREMIGGVFLLDVATAGEAVAIAKACPAAEWCTVEVREVGPSFL